MKYIGEFTNINHVSYKIEIITNGSSASTKNIKLGASPFVTSMNSEGKNIYSPLKGSGATIQLVVNEYIFDLYSESPTGTKVIFTDTTNNEILWQGYVSPQLFNQDFSNYLNEFEVEAIDSLSVLENINYTSENKDVLNFETILRNIFNKVDIRYLYVSNNVQLDSATSTATILDKLFISEMNFFDSKDDGETDADVCWNCADVVSEICQYLGYVAVMIGQDIWLLDYDSIKAGNAQYWRYTLANSTAPTLVTMTHTHNVVGTDHASNNATVSLDEIYNKVSVKADTFVYDEYSNSKAGEQNITRLDSSNFSSEYFSFMGIPITDYIWGEVFPSDDDQSKAMDVWVDAHNDAGGQNTGGKHTYYDFVAMKFIKKPNSKFYLYNSSWQDVTSKYEDNNMSYPDLKDNSGGIYVKYFTKNLEKTKGSSSIGSKFQEYYKEVKNTGSADSSKYLDGVLNKAGIHNIAWTEAIILHNMDGHLRPAESEWYKYPFYEIECEGSIVQGGDHSAMIIQGQFYWHIINKDVYPMEYKDYKLDKGNWINPNVDMFVPVSLQWGNLWWNGKDWQTTKCGFKLNWLSTEYRDDNNTIGKKQTIEQWKCQKTIMQPQPLTNTVDWRFGTDEEGCLITLPKSGTNLSGKPKLTFYRPVSGRVWKSRKDYFNGDNNGKLSGDWGTNNGVRWPWFVVALIGLKFKAIMGDPSYSDANSTDTVYTNVLENDSINELETINFKIHTFDDKENSHGSVGLSGGSSFVNKLYNRALHNNEKTWYESSGGLATSGMRQEEHLIYKLCNQYTTPSKVFECELKLDTVKPYGLYSDTTLPDKYIIDTIDYDYKMNLQSVKMVEKK